MGLDGFSCRGKMVMRALVETMNPLTEINMLLKDTDGKIIFLEGETDICFFKTMLSCPRKIFYKPLGGWEKIVQRVREVNQAGLTRVCGVIDKDYHDILDDGILEIDNLFYTDENDIESILFYSNCYEKFLDVYCSFEKTTSLLDVRQCILAAATPIGALRYVSLKYDENLWFNGVEHKDFIKKDTLTTDVNKLINKIYGRTKAKGNKPKLQLQQVCEMIEEAIAENSPNQLCNGHDILAIISLGTQKVLASHSATTYPPDAVFRHLLMAYEKTCFEQTKMYENLIQWMAA